jgi:hypothetical protein
MLEPTLRELMEDAGIQNINIKYDERGIVGSGEFRGTERQIRRRLGAELDVEGVLETADQPTKVRCRPLR